MNENLHLSPAGANLIKAFEGCHKRIADGRYKPYICGGGRLTIGWGHTNDSGRRFTPQDVWTRGECDAEFLNDMRRFENAVHKLVKVQLEQHQFDALVSFAYNCGAGNLAKSTLLKKVNRGDFDGASREFAKWNKAKGKVLTGLVRRRASEALLFQGIADRDYDGHGDKNPTLDEPIAEEGNPPEIFMRPEPDTMPQIVDPPGPAKPEVQSKSIWTSICVMITSLFAILGQAFEEVKHLITDPTVLLIFTVIIVAGGTFLVHDRRKKLYEDNV